MKQITFFFVILLAVQSTGLAGITLNAQEDFEDENGDPAFDSNFHHLFSTPERPFLSVEAKYPEYGQMLFLGRGDYVTFDLPVSAQVNFASIDVRTWHSSASESYSVTFIGTDSQKVFYPFNPDNTYPTLWHTLTATSEEIGDIIAIDIFLLEGCVDNITVQATVVPEPTAISSMLFIFMTTMLMRLRHYS